MSPRNVIYYNAGNNQISLGGIAQLPYTDVIVANLQPTSAGDLTLIGWGPAFDDQLDNNIRLLQNAGKNVLISFGGSMSPPTTLSTAAYQSYAGNVQELVNQIVSYVNLHKLNGVDIDYEDDAGFGNNPAYDGVKFLSDLTNGLYQNLPPGRNIITHAPQTPYWDSGSQYARGGTPPYFQIWKNVGAKIAWFNNQFYDNQDYDKDAATKVEKYQAVAGLIGAQQLLMGVSLSGDEGAETLSDMVQYVIPPLKAKYGSQFGGVMGWQFSNDQGGAWANGISQALAPASPGPSSNLFIFYQGGNQYSGQLWYTTYDGTNWGQNVIQNLGMSGSPSAALWKGGISVFHQGANNDGQLWYTYSGDGRNWGNPKTDSIVPVSGLQMSDSPSVVEYNGRLYTFFQGGNQYSGQLWYVTYDGTNWGEYAIHNLGMSGSPSAALWKGGISVFHQGANNDGQLWYTYSGDGNNWGNPKTDSMVPVSGLQMSGSPSVVEYNGRLYIFFKGGNQYQGQLWYVTFDGTNWGEYAIHNLGMSGSPSAAVWKGGITVFHQGSGNDGQLWYAFSSDGKTWGTTRTDTQVQGRIISASPSCVVL